MANISPTFTATGDPDCILVRWRDVTEADTCLAVSWGEWADRTVHVTPSVTGGTFGTGGTVLLEGSNNVPDGFAAGGNVPPSNKQGSNFVTMTDPLGNPLSFTATGMKQITELPLQVRPRISAGTGVKIDVHLF